MGWKVLWVLWVEIKKKIYISSFVLRR